MSPPKNEPKRWNVRFIATRAVPFGVKDLATARAYIHATGIPVGDILEVLPQTRERIARDWWDLGYWSFDMPLPPAFHVLEIRVYGVIIEATEQ